MSEVPTSRGASLTRLGGRVVRFQSAAGLNSYAISGGDGWILIDPWDGVDALVRDAFPEAPRRIFLTHFQREHVAGCLAYPGVPLVFPEADFYLAGGEESVRAMIEEWQPPWDWTGRGLFRGNLAGAMNERPLVVSVSRLQPLERTSLEPLCGFLPTPGHGKHAVTHLFEDPELGLVGFPGDLIQDGGTLTNWYDCDWDYGALVGQKTHLASACRLLDRGCGVLCPAHGEPILEPAVALRTLVARMEACISPAFDPGGAINFPERDAAVPGFREIVPGLLQHKVGNCAILISPRSREAVLVDAGPCDWVPVPERRARFVELLKSVKAACGISRFCWVIPTHYHGDHTEGIPWVVGEFGTEVVATKALSRVMESPEKYDIACPLWWYGTGDSEIRCDRKVAEGATVRLGEFDMTFFHLGGQTRHHLGVLTEVEGRRVVFCGDAVSGTGTECDPVLTYNDADPLTAGWPFALQKLRRLEPDVLVAGHGIALVEPRAWLDGKLGNWGRRLAEFHELSGGSKGFFVPDSVERPSKML